MPANMQSGQPDVYYSLYDEFRWNVPARFNIADVCCQRWADDSDRVAVFYENDAGVRGQLSYKQLQHQSCIMAARLARLNVQHGDRVAIVLPQRAEMAVALMACFRLGVVAVPLSVLFGPEALEFRLQDSGAVVAIADTYSLRTVDSIQRRCPSLQHIIAIDADTSDEAERFLESHEVFYGFMETGADDPAILIYTSGTTGAPKGALLPHRALIGNLPGFVASQNWFPQDGDVFWSPADWAWTGGLMDALLPVLYFGRPIVGYRGRFSADVAFRLLERYAVTNTFLFPTALKMMMKAYSRPREHFNLKLRAVMSAGEAVGEAVFEWGRSALGVTINEMFGQTEMNYIIGNSAEKWPAKPGSMGRPYPGHRIAVLDVDGTPVPPYQVGEVALNRTDVHGVADPILFLGYWNNSGATDAKFLGDWCRTGDLASVDEDGYLWYEGRADDMFKAAGYRIGPGEIENCLLGHPAVANVAVVPKPDPERGNLVKAFVMLTAETVRGPAQDQRLIAELQAHVRGRLAPYEYPKEIEFVETLPMTTTGKLQRRILRLLEEEKAKSGGNAAGRVSKD